MQPGIDGGVNWPNPSFDQGRGTIFVPAVESSSVYTKTPPDVVIGKRAGLYVGSPGGAASRGSMKLSRSTAQPAQAQMAVYHAGRQFQ